MRVACHGEIIRYAVFIDKLKELLSFTNTFHKLRLYNQMLHYITKNNLDSISASNIKLDQPKQIHESKIEKHGSLNHLASNLKQFLDIDECSYEQKLQKFELGFPQIQAFFEHNSLNIQTQSYKRNCQIAEALLSQFNLSGASQTKIQTTLNQHGISTQSLLLIFNQPKKTPKVQKNKFYDLAEYSFGYELLFVWYEYSKNMQNNNKLLNLFTQQSEFSNEVVENQKTRLQEFLDKKKIEIQQNRIDLTTFQLFLKKNKKIRMETPVKIITDNFEMDSDSFQCFILSKQLPRNNYQSKNQSQKSKRYPVYLKTRFQMNQLQKNYIDFFRKRLLSLKLYFKDDSCENDEKQQNNNQMELEEENGKSCNKATWKLTIRIISMGNYSLKQQKDNQKCIQQGVLFKKSKHQRNEAKARARKNNLLVKANNFSSNRYKLQQVSKYLKSYKQLNASLSSTQGSLSFQNNSKSTNEKDGAEDQESQKVNKLPQIFQKKSNARLSQSEEQDNYLRKKRRKLSLKKISTFNLQSIFVNRLRLRRTLYLEIKILKFVFEQFIILSYNIDGIQIEFQEKAESKSQINKNISDKEY